MHLYVDDTSAEASTPAGVNNKSPLFVDKEPLEIINISYDGNLDVSFPDTTNNKSQTEPKSANAYKTPG